MTVKLVTTITEMNLNKNLKKNLVNNGRPLKTLRESLENPVKPGKTRSAHLSRKWNWFPECFVR